MKNKSLTVIIPAYNAEKYIGECLGSLKGFMGEDLEIIVIDDGSTDNTSEVIDSCSLEDSRIRYLSNSNAGVSKARNTGLKMALGRYIMFLDADDYILSDTRDLIAAVIEKDKYDFAAFSRMIVQEGKESWNDRFFFKESESTDKRIIDSIMYADSHFNECWAKLYRKKIIEDYNISFVEGVPVGEDMMFVMEYYSHCEQVYACNSPLVAYRQHGSSAMRRYGLEDRLKFTCNLFEYSGKYVPEYLSDSYWFYNFKILTNLCREYSADKADRGAIKEIYLSEMSKAVMNNLRMAGVPLYRKHEFFMMKQKLYSFSAIYYHMKAAIAG